MKGKKLVLVLDAIVIAMIIFAMTAGKAISKNFIQNSQKALADRSANANLSFNLIANPEEKRVKAGETVEITLSLKDINIGENGLNSIVGKLGYDEKLFESMDIKEIRSSGENSDTQEDITENSGNMSNWEIELNKIQGHELYGKFCMYIMEEGVTDNQDIAKITLKLKEDVTPQTTKVIFTEIASSDGNVEVKGQDREVRIVINGDEENNSNNPTPDNPSEDDPTQNKPTENQSENESKTDESTQEKSETDKSKTDGKKSNEASKDQTNPVQTSDKTIPIIVAILILTIILNILVFTRKDNKDNNDKDNKDNNNKNNKATKIMSTILVIVLGLSCAKAVSYAIRNINIQEATNQLKIQQTWLNSDNYLVTEENVSRVPLGTSMTEMVSKFNKEVLINQSNTTAEEGITATGMKIKVKNASDNNGKDAEGNKEYTVSVWGDLNGDGKSNQVDLTSIIKNVKNPEGWELKGEKYLSADLTTDKSIGMDDINASVKYIVYGTSQISTFNKVTEPRIELISGLYDDDLKCYVTNVKLKITEQETDSIKTEYKIENTQGEVQEFTAIEKESRNEDGKYEKIINLTDDEIYKISAYTTGTAGNRSGIPYLLVNKGNTDTEYAYRVEYYYDEVLNNDETITRTAKFGTELGAIENIAQYTEQEKAGYEKQKEKGTNGVEGLTTRLGKNIQENVIKVYYKTTKYSVKYYFEDEDGEYKHKAGRPTEERHDKKSGETATIKNDDKDPHLTGYEYNEEKSSSEISKEVQYDGSTVLNVYFKRKYYTVKLLKGLAIKTVNAKEILDNESDPENANQGEEITVKYGKNVEITATGDPETGYTYDFEEWTGIHSEILANTQSPVTTFKMPCDNMTLTAVGKQTPNTNTPYKIEYYVQENGTYPETANKKESKTGTTGETAKVALTNLAMPNEIIPEGKTADQYVLDTATISANGTINAQNELNGTIAGNGSLTLKIYFKQQFKVEYKKGLHAAEGEDGFVEVTIDSLDYGTATPTYPQTIKPQPGYAFDKWLDENENTPAETVTEDKVYTAQWKEAEYTITYNLVGGKFKDEDIENVKYTYKMGDADYTLISPIKHGFTFMGWTGSNGETPETTVTLQSGVYGDKSYTAVWQADTYTITYYQEVNGGTQQLITEQGYTREYTIETGNITIPAVRPQTGYDFVGWTGEETTENANTIALNTTEEGFELKNRTYTAHIVSKSGITYRVEYYGEPLLNTATGGTDEEIPLANYVYLGGNTFTGNTADDIYISKDEPQTPYDSYTTVDTTIETTPVTMKFPVFTGFTLDQTKQENWTGVISAEEETVLKAYYTRNSYTLTLNKNELVDSTTGTGTYKYEKQVAINATVKDKTGYTVTFKQWKSYTENVADIVTTDPSKTFTMPAKDVVLEAQAEDEIAQNKYTVEYYYEDENGDYVQKAERPAQEKTDKKTTETAELSEEDKQPQLDGYEYNQNKTKVVEQTHTATVVAEGTTILKAYFNRKTYTVTLQKGTAIQTVKATDLSTTGGNPEDVVEGETITVKYGKNVEITATGESVAGYTFEFTEWAGTYADNLANKNRITTTFQMPYDNVTLTAIGQQKPDTDTSYAIEYYHQANGEYPETANTSTPMTGTTGKIAKVALEDVEVPEGYALDETKIRAEGTVNDAGELYGTIASNGTLKLKIYFKQQFKVEYKKGLHGAEGFEEKTYAELDYNDDIPAYTGTIVANEGYEFARWSPEKPADNKVKQNLTYTATYNAITYTITYNNLLNGEFPAAQAENVKYEYNIETDTFTLINPERHGYSFEGWTSEDTESPITTPTTTVTITKGTTGNKTYIANWTPEEYTITYNYNNGTLPEGQTNPETYTIETATFTLKNPSKEGYTFKGWVGTDLPEENEQGEGTTTVTLAPSSEGFELKNRSYTALLKPNSDIQYKVEYYTEDLDGNGYTLAEENYLPGTMDATVNIDTTKEITGFTFDNTDERNVLNGTVKITPMLVLKAYYKRNTYTLTLQKEAGISSAEAIIGNPESAESPKTTITGDTVESTISAKYGETVSLNATVGTLQGYDVSFGIWTLVAPTGESNQTGLTNKTGPEASFVMPASDITYKATPDLVALNAGYTVEYYYEGNSGYEEEPTSTDTTRVGQIGSQVEITLTDKTSTKTGWEYDQNKTEVVEQSNITTVSVDGNAKLKVYFKKGSYTLTISAGNEQISGTKVVTGVKLTPQSGTEQTGENSVSNTFCYEDTITIDATFATIPGYTLGISKWSSNNTELMANIETTNPNQTITMPAGNITLTVVPSIEPKDSSYTIEYYYQNADGTYPNAPEAGDIVVRSTNVKVGDSVSLSSADIGEAIKTGYVYDSNAEGKVEQGTVAVDNSENPITVLKAYYKKQFTVTYMPGEHGDFEQKVYENLDYNADIPAYIGEYTGKDGYVFDTWTTESTATTVTENIVYTATWKPMLKPTITHTPTAWTNQNVTVTMTKPDGYSDYTIEYKIGNAETYTAYTQEFEVETNSTVYGRLYKGTNYGEPTEHEITNIDKVAPVFANTSIDTSVTDEGIVTITITDNLSGIVEYGVKEENESIYVATIVSDNPLEKEVTIDEIYENGTYDIYAKDKAGNRADTTVEVAHIIPPPVAKIVSAPEGYEALVGQEYQTLGEALTASDTAAQEGNVKIQIIHGVHDEANVIKANRKYTIDLNDYTVQNISGKVAENIGGLTANADAPALIVDGELTLVDEGTVMDKGLLVDRTGVGIYITLNGKLTLGVDGNGAPDTYSPVVQGLTYGIEKQMDTSAEKVQDPDDEKYYYPEGKLYFYDGKVIGGTAALNLQKINDTPLLYDPTVAINPVTNNQESTLAIVSGIEATIGKKRYVLLEKAIEAANNTIGTTNDQIEIKIVKNINKDADHKIVVDGTKNIKLDLNGYTFTTSVEDYVLENYGELEICDSSEIKDLATGEIITAGTGKITSSVANTINNVGSDITQYEYIDLSTAVNNGTYYFENRADGLISNNNGYSNTTANSYLELDLSDKEGIYTVTTITSVQSEASYDFGYLTVTSTTTAPSYDNENGRKIYVSGTQTDKITNFELSGGQKYYIHLGYRKDKSTDTGSDCFTVKSIKYGKHEQAGSMKITSGTVECTKNGSNKNNRCYAIINRCNLYVNGGNIKSSGGDYTAGISNLQGYTEVNGGKFNATRYNIINEEKGTLLVNDGTFTSSYIGIANTGILTAKGQNTKITGNTYAIYIYNSGKTTIEDGTYIGNEGIRHDGTGIVTIKGGNFKGSSKAICNWNKGTIKVENATILGAKTGVHNESSGTIEIDNIDMTQLNSSEVPVVTTAGICNYGNGNTVINGGNIHSNGNGVEQRGSTGKVTINNGTIRGNSRGAFVSYGTLEMNDGNLIGGSNGVYMDGGSSYTTTANIKGGTVESTSDSSSTISFGYSNTTVNIGVNDDVINTSSPVIKGKKYTINTKAYGTLNFYDGELIGTENCVLLGAINEIPSNTDLVKEIKEDGLQHVTLGIPTVPVAQISATDSPDVTGIDASYYTIENGYYKFTTLESAIQACNTTNHTTIELIEDNIWIYKKLSVSENQDISIEFNNNSLRLYKAGINFENSGKLELKNADTTSKGILISTRACIVNNLSSGELKLDNIRINANNEIDSSDKLIYNSGKCTISNSTFSGSKIKQMVSIYNAETGRMLIENSELVHTYSGKQHTYIENYGKDTIDGDTTIYSMVLRNVTISNSTTNSTVLYNKSSGTIDIKNSTLTGTLHMYNSSTGKILMDNTSATGYSYNESTGKYEITNSTIGKLYNNSTGEVTCSGASGKLNYITNAQGGTANLNNIIITASTDKNVVNSGTMTITDVTINTAIVNNSTGTLTISGNTVQNYTGTSYPAITNAGTATILSGKITSAKYGIENTGTLTLGQKDRIVNYNPIIQGVDYGISNTKTLNFYDGIIEGKTSKSITGTTPADTEEGSSCIIVTGEIIFDDGTEDKYSVASGKEISVLDQILVAHVASSGEDYLSLKDAYDHTESTDTIELIHDLSINGNTASLTIEEGKNITLDLKGYNITAGNNNTFVNNGTFTIKDTKRTVNETTISGKISSGATTIINNKANCIIESGFFELTVAGTSSDYRKMINNTGDLTIEGGTLKARVYYCTLISQSGGNLTINGGTLYYYSYAKALVIADGNVVINNCSVTYESTGTTQYDFIVNTSGDITINNGNIKGYIDNNNSLGKMKLYGGTLDIGSVSNSGTLDVGKQEEDTETGEIVETGPVINGYISNSGTCNIKGGQVKSNSEKNDSIYNSGTMTITGGTILNNYAKTAISNSGTMVIDGTGRTADNPIIIKQTVQYVSGSGINSSGGTLSIDGYVSVTGRYSSVSVDGGTANIKGNTTLTSDDKGIVSSYNAVVIIGDSNNINNNVKINGNSYGIQLGTSDDHSPYMGTLKYYGGTIKGNKAIYGYIDAFPENYDIIRTTDENGKEIYEIGHAESIVSVNGNPYNSLKEAIQQNNGGTIVVEKDFILTKAQKVTIPSNKNFTLNLNGKNIKLHARDNMITNEGSLKITDGTDDATGKFTGYCTNVVKNLGNFEFEKGSIVLTHIQGNYMIYNGGTGTLSISGGTFKAAVLGYHVTYIIKNESTNSVNISGGTFTGAGSETWSRITMIYSDVENALINITGGTFTGGSATYKYCVYANKTTTININGNATFSELNYVINTSGESYVRTINITDVSLSSEYAISANKNDIINITNSTLTCSKNAIVGGKDVVLNSGTVTGTNRSFSGCRNLDIYEATVNGTIYECTNVKLHNGASVTYSGTAVSAYTTLNIENATIAGKVYANKDSTLNMTAGSITGSDSGIEINNANAKVNIKEGTVTATAGPGILLTKGKVTLGEDTGGYPSIEIPSITGSTYGIKNDGGTVNFYDGILTGGQKAHTGAIASTPELFSVQYSTDEKVATLGINATFSQVATVNGIYYDDLQSAINAAARINGEVIVGKEIYLEGAITIPSGSTVTIDLAGSSIYGFTETATITVEGANTETGTTSATLIIKDSEAEDTTQYLYNIIENNMGPVIENNGTLTIGENDSTVYEYSPQIIGKTISIINNGTLNFYDGQIGTQENGTPITVDTTTNTPAGYTKDLQGNKYKLIVE